MANQEAVIMDVDASEQIGKRLTQNQMALEKLTKESTGVYKELREAKAYTETGFGISQKFREHKEAKYKAGVESEEAGGKGISRTRANVGAAKTAVGAGLKQGAGMLQSDKFMSGAGIKSMGSMVGGGMLHAAGAASGNPLLNLMASGMSSRRKRIQSARQDVHEQEQQDIKDKETEGKEDEAQDSIQEAAGLTPGSDDHLKLIESNTDYSNTLLEDLAREWGVEVADRKEAQEDEDLDTENIVKAKSAKKEEAAIGVKDVADEAADGGLDMMDIAGANMLTNMLPKIFTGGIIKTMLGTVLPVVMTAMAAGAIGTWINDTFLMNKDGTSKLVEGATGAGEEFKKEYDTAAVETKFKEDIAGGTTEELQESIKEMDNAIARAQEAAGWFTNMEEEAGIGDLETKRAALVARQTKLRAPATPVEPEAAVPAAPIEAAVPVAPTEERLDRSDPMYKVKKNKRDVQRARDKAKKAGPDGILIHGEKPGAKPVPKPVAKAVPKEKSEAEQKKRFDELLKEKQDWGTDAAAGGISAKENAELEALGAKLGLDPNQEGTGPSALEQADIDRAAEEKTPEFQAAQKEKQAEFGSKVAEIDAERKRERAAKSPEEKRAIRDRAYAKSQAAKQARKEAEAAEEANQPIVVPVPATQAAPIGGGAGGASSTPISTKDDANFGNRLPYDH